MNNGINLGDAVNNDAVYCGTRGGDTMTMHNENMPDIHEILHRMSLAAIDNAGFQAVHDRLAMKALYDPEPVKAMQLGNDAPDRVAVTGGND